MSTKPDAGGTPVIPTAAAWSRVSAAVKRVEGASRSKPPYKGNGFGAWSNPGGWGWLAPGDYISAVAGDTLGVGTVTLCSRVGRTLTPDGDEVTAYNAGGQVDGDPSTGTYLKLGWTDGVWSLDVAACP